MTKIVKTEQEWLAQLGEQAYYVCRQKGTERPFTGKYWDHTESGIYHCVACGEALFASATKFDAGCGWPSYFQPLSESVIKEEIDVSHNMRRVEVMCQSCGSHLGHVFPDGPRPTGLRYCINSASLVFNKEKA